MIVTRETQTGPEKKHHFQSGIKTWLRGSPRFHINPLHQLSGPTSQILSVVENVERAVVNVPVDD